MKLLLILNILILTSCSIYQSYGRKSFEEQSASATLTEQLQIQIVSCSEFKENLNSTTPTQFQMVKTLVSENETDLLYEQNINNYILIDKMLNHSCTFTGNTQAIQQLSPDSTIEFFINFRTQYFQDISP